jgi:hypothetical protein
MSLDTLQSEIDTLKNETRAGANTANRVGSILKNIVGTLTAEESSKIADGAVTNTKIADGAVSSGKINKSLYFSVASLLFFSFPSV